MCMRIRGCDGIEFVYVHAMGAITTLTHIMFFLSHYHKYDNVRETEYDDLDSHITYVNAISFLLASLAMFKLSAIPIHQQPS